MKSIGILTLITLMCSNFGLSQDYEVKHKEPAKPHTVNFSSINEDYFSSLHTLKKPKPGGEKAEEQLEAIKAEYGPKQANSRAKNQESAPIEAPQASKGFQGNKPDGVPNDNDLAINQDGTIVSVTNSRISIFDTSGKRLERHSLGAFADTLNLTGNKFDPRVDYDPRADRFVLLFLNGTVDSTSQIVVAFSESSDPTDNWNLYSLPGDAVNDGSWSDFPAIALTKDEVFITVNLLYNDSTWEAGFRQSIVWQLDKQAGYNGKSLNQTVYSNITFSGRPLRNLTPLQGGKNLKGPEVHIISNDNFATQSQRFFVATITGKANDPNTQLNINLVQADEPYSVPPSADQPFRNTGFETNDARILDGYQVDNTLHFVGNSRVLSNNKAGIYHGKLTNPQAANTMKLEVTAAPGKELGYPSIAFGEKQNGEHMGLIIANHSSNNTKPGFSGMRFQGVNHSAVKTLKQGSSSVDRQQAEVERWGDYSGLQRRYNGTKTYWAAAYYGFEKNLAKENGTWISRIRAESLVGKEETQAKANAFEAYPNPIQNRLNLKFKLEQAQMLTFTLYNAGGQRIQTIHEEFTASGTHRFQFSVAPLASGSYVLKVRSPDNLIATKKLLK